MQPLPTADNSRGTTNGIRHGYAEYRITLKNTSDEDRKVELTCGSPVFRMGTTAMRTVRVAAGQETTVSLFQPPAMNHSITVEVEKEPDPKEIFIQPPFDRTYNEVEHYAVLTSRGVPQDFRDSPPKAAPAPGSPPPAPSPTPASEPLVFLRSEIPVTEWSGNWLGYSGYDAIVVTGEEVEQMPPAVRMALRRYLECGGTLLVHAAEVPNVFSEGGEPDGQGGFWVGFGHAVPGGSDAKDDKDAWATTREKLTNRDMHEYHPLEKPVVVDQLLVSETSVPVRGLFILVLLFGIGIGPVNLWVLSRWKRRIWLWWNVPLLSAAACVAVFAYALFSEGITGHGRVASFTLLDERCHRATTLGYLSFYCPLTPSVGPHFGIDTDVALLSGPMLPWMRYHEAGNRILDWTTDQWLASGWVTARIPAYLQIRKNEDRRERLSVEPQPDGSVKVVNALGAAIRRLSLADASGRIFEATDIPAGAEHTIKSPILDKKSLVVRQLSTVFLSKPWLPRFGQIVAMKDSMMPAPGCYVAILDESPFVERPLQGIESQDTAAIVYGISKE